MKRSLLAALTTLLFAGCGDAGSSSATLSSSRELSGAERTAAATRALQSVKGLGLASRFEAADLDVSAAVADDSGREHVRFSRAHRGLRVVGGDVVLHLAPGGTLEDLSGNDVNLAPLSLQPRVDAAAATVTAEAAFGAGQVGSSSAELVVNARTPAPTLAYEVRVDGFREDGTPSERHILVDALTGSVQEQWDDIHTAGAVGTGKSLYSGTVSLNTNSISGGFELRDTTRGSGFYTTNMNSRTNGGSIFTDADNAWGSGTTADAASAAVDAHYGQAKTYDFYKNVLGRNGIDNAGGVGYSRVHYSRRYNNAFWSDSCFCMTYGDGDGSTFLPLVALDIAGHEMSHGVTSRSANLTYSGESGGLNEGTSDIFGAMVEYYAGTSPNYLIGEQTYTPAKAGDALRYMYKPSLDGRSPDCYTSTIGSLDVHYSSGVANHAFYLIAEGSNPAGGPASPTCNGSTVTGVGRDAAAKIWYRALTVYMTSSTNYAGARQATLKAAADLYGASSSQYASVAAAWSAVSVN